MDERRKFGVIPVGREAGVADRVGVEILYDGQCPFCAAYVRMLRLRDAAGPVRLVDARSDAPEASAARAAGLDLDAGMVVRLDGATYHGDRALNVLALLSTGSGPFNALTRRIFASERAARRLYPLLAAGRRAALALLGRSGFNAIPPDPHHKA